ncbi:hypothetical protein AOE01nite_35370 [Acetobacter oeni]|uniref:TonB-dependent receptor-like beta-barrel domain-containing protein n=1 Tax=Acetobacter oeni TaxID=304077 RepID=A0A511XQT1_9PROT|nr:hypothetical protein AA21952_1752 [Acetobacter oeni LMG 21952]GEN65313.1 hypothetical protein AOE01nite_35370 [Acetobacter oeni]
MPGGGDANPNNLNYALYNPDGSRAYDGPVEDAGYGLHAIFMQDSAKYLHDKLKIIGGFKYAIINYWQLGSDGSRTRENNKAPLPHLAISYDTNDHNQIYVKAEGNYRQPNPSNITVNPGSSLPRNQYSVTEQLGYKYHDNHIMLDLSLFNYDIKNRPLTTYLGNGETGVINAGNQTARGFDLMVAGRPIRHFSPYASFEYLHATLTIHPICRPRVWKS